MVQDQTQSGSTVPQGTFLEREQGPKPLGVGVKVGIKEGNVIQIPDRISLHGAEHDWQVHHTPDLSRRGRRVPHTFYWITKQTDKRTQRIGGNQGVYF